MGHCVIASPALFVLTFTCLLKIGVCEVPENDLFPYGHPDLDTQFQFGDDFNRKIDFSIGLNFFNATYNSTFLSGNGQVTFGRELLQYTPECSPRNIPMIMAFWADSIDDSGAKLLYRESRNRTLLQKAATDIFLAFPQLTGIRLNWMLIVTWKKITFFGANIICRGDSKRNTFQLVLTTDGYYTFALMYYNKIEWTTGTTRTSGGDCSGLGGNPAKVGFDFGDGKTFYTVPGSCTDAILNITQTSNINQPGKWVFRIDGNLETSTCEDFNFTTTKLLKLTPNVVPYSGFQQLRIEGPCLKAMANAVCIFHDVLNKTEVEGLISTDYRDVVCPLPLFKEFGRKKVELKVSYPSRSGAREDFQIYTGYLYVVDDNNQEDHLKISVENTKGSNTTDDNDEALTLNVFWNETYFKGKQKVDIHLKLHNGHNWMEVQVLKAALENTGRWQGPIKKKFLEKISMKIPNIEKPLFAITMSTSNENERFGKKLSSSLFTGVQVISESASLTFTKPCLRGNIFKPTGDNGLACPMTLELAEIDDNFENIAESDSETRYTIKRQKIPTVFGEVSQCVYDSFGNLVLKEAGSFEKTPTYEDCNRNVDIHPHSSNNGSEYAGRMFARATGATHISTFAGSTYTFNGVGEFWIVKFNERVEFKAQVRMEQYISSTDRKSNVSVITAVAMEEVRNGESVRVQVSSAQQKILVVVDGIPVEIDSKQLLNDFTTRIKSCSITIKKSSSPQETVIVTFFSGFSFKFSTVGPAEVALNIISSANSNVLNVTEGLLVKVAGQFDTPSFSTPEAIHRDLVSNWMILEQDSLFYYRPGESYRTFHKPDFTPNFKIDSSQPVPKSVNDFCDQHKECIFDYVMTGSTELANATLAAWLEYAYLVQVSKKGIKMGHEQPNGQGSKKEEQPRSSTLSLIEVIYIVVYVLLAVILSTFVLLCVFFIKRQVIGM